MSRWWADTVVVAPTDLSMAARSTELVLASFAEEIDRIQPTPRARIVAVVGGDAVRLRVVPWNDALVSPRDRQVLAMQSFVEAYGDTARDWSIQEHASRFGAPTLAAAIDPALLEGLRALTAARGLRLGGVEPAFTRAFDARRRQTRVALGWFVLIERHLTTALLFTSRAPVHLRRYVAPHAELGNLLRREWFALGREDPSCQVFVERAVGAERSEVTIGHVSDAGFPMVELTAASPRPSPAAPVAA